MADGRTTQFPTLTIGRGDSDGRVTQFACLTIGRQTVPGRTTQMAVLTIGYEPVPGRTTQAYVITVGRHIAPCGTRWAHCWIIRRTDGEVLGFTDLDSALTVSGVVCGPCKSLNGGALELSAPMGSIGNQDVTGLIDDDRISEADLYAGVYDDATVEIWLTPWEPDPLNPSAARVAPDQVSRRLARGRTGKVSHGETVFTAEVLTDGARLEQTALVQSFSPGCRWVQYDGRCGLSYDANKVESAVTGIAAPSPHNMAARRVFFDSDRTEASGAFDGGLLIWTGGANAGQRQEVKQYEQTGGRFTLWDTTLNPIAPGDTYEVAPTCKNTVAGCKSFANYVNYGGFPDVPGQDEIIKSPDFKSG